MSRRISPFRFPATVVLVDDNPDFLANIGLQLDSNLALRRFTSPLDALVAINGMRATAPSVERFFSVYAERDEYRADRHVVAVSLDSIQDIVRDPERFATVSVVVVDYDMPEIDGLEFCRNIRNPFVRKILLTGKADERTAVRAFNEGLIDRFIRKQEPDVVPMLNLAIEELQCAFFDRGERMLSAVLAVGAYGFLADPAFAERLGVLQRSHRIVEHYLACRPDGLLMLDASGNAWRLVVMDGAALQSQIEIAREMGAPQDLVRALASGHVVPWFWRSDGAYASAEPDGMACLHPAEVCGEYRYALIPCPPGTDSDAPTSYENYLMQIDAQA